MIFFIIIISSFVICGVIALNINYLADQSQHAMAEFNRFSNPGRESSTQELEEFTKKWDKTASSVLFCHKFLGFITQKLNESETFFRTYPTLFQQNNQLHSEIISTEEWAMDFEQVLNEYFSYHYFTHSEKETVLHENQAQIELFNCLYPLYREYFTIACVASISDTLRHFERLRKEHNINYVKEELERNKNFFDHILRYPLDRQQREAIVTEEDNTLIISGAGSGKTSTLIGKLNYLIECQNVQPENILALSYTRSAADELRQRIAGNQDVNCSTFHKLALDILTTVEGRRPCICDNGLIISLFHELINNNIQYKEHVYNYITRQQSLAGLSHQYNTTHDHIINRKKYGVLAPFADARGRLIFTKSEEEKRLCILLTELGIDFLYEEYYPYQTNMGELGNYRQYKPDFTILIPRTITNPETGAETTQTERVYLEHFAINSEGNVPAWFADNDPHHDWENQNRKYNDGIQWKRATHISNGTTLIETRSADFQAENIRDVLIQRLQEANVPIHERTKAECYPLLVSLNKKEAAVGQLMDQFIAITKSNNIDLQQIINQAEERHDRRTIYIINNLVRPLFDIYNTELNRRHEIDFVDAINRATEHCLSGQYIPNYSHILVDEFQDISKDRFHLLQAMRRQRPLTKLFCVGDDWQSIYRFGGSDIKLFYKFEEYFGATKTFSIQTTYRLRDPLLTLSSNFIMQNPEQTRRVIIPQQPEPPTDIHLIPCGIEREYGLRDQFFHICRGISQEESILVLGRYNSDAKTIDSTVNTNAEQIFLNVNDRKLRYLSVHRSKGLEADNIILINCHSGIYGFPSLIEDDPILSYLLSDADSFENAEERRLFYVALTRAKKRIYILFYSDIPSPFLRELSLLRSTNECICPICQDGNVVHVGYGIAINGNPYKKYTCTNNRIGCTFYERRFNNNPHSSRDSNSQIN